MKKRLIYFLALWMILLLLPPAFARAETAFDLSVPGLRIGVATGTIQEHLVRQLCPEAEIYHFEKVDGCTAVAQGKIDCYLYDKRQLEIAVKNGQAGIRVLNQTVGDSFSIALGISEVSTVPDLADRVNAFIDSIRADGTLDEIYNRWVIRDERDMPDIPRPSSPKYHLTVGTTGIVEPYSYYEGSQLTGFDIELIYRLAAWLNADVTFEIYDYGSIVAACHAGKADLIAANLQVTPERAEALRFSEPLFQMETGIVVRKTEADDASAEVPDVHWQDYNGKRIGVLVGPLMEGTAHTCFPDSEYLLFNSYPDCVAALLTGKIDAFLGDEPEMKSLHAELPAIDYIHDSLTENNYSFAFRKNDAKSAALCQELDAFLSKAWADGTIQELEDIWLGTEEDRKLVDMSDLSGENGTVRVVTTAADMPWSYVKDGKNVGYDIDLVVRFCRDRGYALELGDVDFAGRIPAIQSGKYDFTTDMNVTPEREEQVLFSTLTAHGGIVLAVRTSDLTAADTKEHVGAYKTLDELAGRRIGILTGSIHGELVARRLPTAKPVYYSDLMDLPAAMEAKKIDAFASPYSSAVFMQYENKELTWLAERLLDTDLAFAFPKSEKGEALNAQFSDYLRTRKADGSLDEIVEKWFGEDESAKTMPDYASLPPANGVLRLATEGLQIPFSYVRSNTVVGCEIELAARFCEEKGYGLQVEQMDSDGILAAVQTEKCDFAASGIRVTEERKQSIGFSEPYYTDGVVIVVPNTSEEEKGASFLDGLAESFEKTFLRENRWKLFLQGIWTTFLITMLSILFGTLLGFLVFMLCRNGNPTANAVTRFCMWLVQGMPMVVLLMILYYIVFGSVSISGIVVAVIGFTLTFGAAVFGLLKTGVGAIDRGQYEAAFALGHSNRRTFYYIILPQAIPHVLPAYRGEIVGLLKATAVVGYIAVQDLTKMGDIVRSRTYEAFFPLIAVTVIYFCLEGIMNMVLRRIQKRIDPKKRSKERILKGVKTDD